MSDVEERSFFRPTPRVRVTSPRARRPRSPRRARGKATEAGEEIENPYIQFYVSRYPAVSEQHSELPLTAIARIISEEWKKLPSDDKRIYETKASNNRAKKNSICFFDDYVPPKSVRPPKNVPDATKPDSTHDVTRDVSTASSPTEATQQNTDMPEITETHGVTEPTAPEITAPMVTEPTAPEVMAAGTDVPSAAADDAVFVEAGMHS